MSDEVKLANCPFCEGEPRIITADSEMTYMRAVHCIRCHACTGKKDSADEAIAAWNRRSDPAVLALREARWQPIETAPKNDHSIVIDVFGAGARYTDCRWGSPTYGSRKGHYGWVYVSGYDYDGIVEDWVPNPTHWMPLPKEPDAAAPTFTLEDVRKLVEAAQLVTAHKRPVFTGAFINWMDDLRVALAPFKNMEGGN